MACADPRTRARREDTVWGCPLGAHSPSWQQPSGVVVTMATATQKQAEGSLVGWEADAAGQVFESRPRRHSASLRNTACVQLTASGKGPRPLHQAGGPVRCWLPCLPPRLVLARGMMTHQLLEGQRDGAAVGPAAVGHPGRP